MLKTKFFDNAYGISPKLSGNWPVDFTQPVFWVAKKTFTISELPESCMLNIALDRHYEIYVNQQLAIRQRGFFNGDEYIFTQQWGDELLKYLRPGENTLEIVIRSDPWITKNHRTFMPMLICQGRLVGKAETIAIHSDETWRVSVIKNWNKFIAIGGCETIAFFETTLPKSSNAILSGFSDDLKFAPPAIIDKIVLPKFIEWNDTPVEVDTLKPLAIIANSPCVLPQNTLEFDISRIEESPALPLVFETSFQADCEEEIHIAASALMDYKIEFNNQIVALTQGAPDPNQMQLCDYLTPLPTIKTKPGKNSLCIRIDKKPAYITEFLLAISCSAKNANNQWLCDRNPIIPKQLSLETWLSVGAKPHSGEPQKKSPAKLPIKISPSNQPHSLLLDFGRATTARVKLKLKANSSGKIYLGYGMMLNENAVDCSRMMLRAVDVLNIPEGQSHWISFDVRTFRYLDLIFPILSGEIEISEISVEEHKYIKTNKSEFTCDNHIFDKLWNLSCRTAQLCANEIYMDNPEREHTQWVDCTVANTAAGYYIAGEKRKAEKVLREFAWTQQPDGQIAGFAPGRWFPRKPLQCHMALYALGCHRHFMHTGNEKFAIDSLAVIEKMIRHWQGYAQKNHLLYDIHTVFVDWGSHIYSYGCGCDGPTGALTTINAYYLGVLRAAAELAQYTGQDKLTKEFSQMAAELSKAILNKFFDANIGLFRDGIGNPLAENNYSQTANTLAVNHGAVLGEMGRDIMTKAFSTDESIDIIPANAHFIRQAGQALFDAGCDSIALKWIENGFGSMCDSGSGTLWETWDTQASLCQSTGAGISYLLARYVMGIYPAQPGYKAIGIAPQPGYIKNAKATLATPFGLIQACWQKNGENIDYQLSLPKALKETKIIQAINIASVTQ